jgi:hypothetical protein
VAHVGRRRGSRELVPSRAVAAATGSPTGQLRRRQAARGARGEAGTEGHGAEEKWGGAATESRGGGALELAGSAPMARRPVLLAAGTGRGEVREGTGVEARRGVAQTCGAAGGGCRSSAAGRPLHGGGGSGVRARQGRSCTTGASGDVAGSGPPDLDPAVQIAGSGSGRDWLGLKTRWGFGCAVWRRGRGRRGKLGRLARVCPF